jgi:hypothetical protein
MIIAGCDLQTAGQYPCAHAGPKTGRYPYADLVYPFAVRSWIRDIIRHDASDDLYHRCARGIEGGTRVMS